MLDRIEIILFMIVLSKCKSCSEDNRELQEEPTTPIAPIDIEKDNCTIRRREDIYQ